MPPDPRERAEAVQDAWQHLRAQAARRGAGLQAALLVQQVGIQRGDELRAVEPGVEGERAPSLPLSPQYFVDAADATTWLQELQSGLESAPCAGDQAGAEALLLNHLRLERTLSVVSAELHGLEERARAAAARASLTVWGRGGAGQGRAGPGPRATGLAGQMRVWSLRYSCLSWPHKGWRREDICGS